jgi:predicted AAA+ superfamily ATPase
LEETRLLTRLERDNQAGTSARVALRSQPKIFASDHGLITAFSPHPEPIYDPDTRARVFEAVVFRHLRELARTANATISFGRLDDDLEVDFIVRYADTCVGVEVTSSADARVRKLRRADEAMSRMGITRKLLVHGGVRIEEGGGLEIVPLHEFLLNPARYAGDTP